VKILTIFINKIFKIMIDNKIKKRLKELKLTQKEFCEQIKMTPSGFRSAISNKTLQLKTLEKISSVLAVPMSYWFMDVNNVNIIDTHKIFSALEKMVMREINNGC
jgi:transcriptional regulator with XRE-family HTH domain